MKFDAFIGGSYESQSYSADQERTINWYIENTSSPGASSRRIFLPTPGVEPITVAYDGVGRGHLYIDGREFAVIGDRMYEITKEGTKTSFGQVSTSDRAFTPVTIDSNGDLGGQLLVVTDETSYYVDITAASPIVAEITALSGKSTFGGYLDGYGLCLDVTSSTLYISALGDFSSWTTGTDFAQRSLAGDPWLSMKVAGRYIWLFGEQTTEIWQDVGTRFPFAPIVSAVLDYGIKAPYSVAQIGTDVYWLAQDRTGRISVMRAGGVNPQVISTPETDYQISLMENISDAMGDTYSMDGHTFYLLHFDTAKRTLCWDINTGEMHERGTWDETVPEFKSWSPRHFVYAFGENRSLDRMVSVNPLDVDSGNTSSFVYKLSSTFMVDVNGKSIRRVRRAPAIVNENKRVFYPEFEVFGDVGETQAAENFATVALTAQSASIAETTLFTTGTEIKPYVVNWDLVVTTTTSDFALNGSVAWYVDGTQVSHYFGSLTEESDSVRLRGSIPIRPDALTAVSYFVNYTSTVAGMEYSADVTVEIPGTTDPQAMLRMSNDGGKTWGSENWHSAGKTGEYGTRIHWHRLGVARRRVFEFAVSDSLPWRITDAFLPNLRVEK